MDGPRVSQPFDRMLVQVAEEAAARSKTEFTAVGTVSSVETATLRASVVFDGSGGAVPCLVGSPVHPVAGDRVGIVKFGAEWVILTVLGVLRGLGAGGVSQSMGTGTAPVGSWGNIAGTPQFTFTKRWDATRVRWAVSLGCYTTVLGTTIQSGITYNGGSTTIKTGQYTFANNGGDPALDAHTFSYWTYQSGLAAGTYTVTGRWQSDANIQSTSGDDWVSIEGTELI